MTRATRINRKAKNSDAKLQDQAVYEASELLNSRMHGRCRGEAVTVEWNTDRHYAKFHNAQSSTICHGDSDIARAGAWLKLHNDNSHGIRIVEKGE